MHQHHHHHSEKNLAFAFILNISFAIIELIGGFLTNSMSILSDALHDLGDSLAIALSLGFEKFSKKQRDTQYTYGYKRFSIISALISSIILITGSLLIIYHSIPRLFSPEPVQASGMFWLALIGIGVNGLAYFRIKKGTSANERVVSLHLLEDILGWMAVFVGSIVIYFSSWFIIDPILSLCIAVYILWNVSKNLKEFFEILLQRIPNNIDIDLLQKRLININEVVNIHDFHIWTIDSNYHVLSLHLVLSSSTDKLTSIKIKHQTKEIIKSFGINHETVEIEYENEICDFIQC